MVPAAESRAEIGRMIVAAAVRNFTNGVIVALHQLHRHLHTVLGEKIKHWLAIQCFESCFEFELIDAGGLRQGGNGVVITQIFQDGLTYKSKSLHIGFCQLDLHSKRFN